MRSPWVQFWNLAGNLFVGWSLYGNSLYGNDCASLRFSRKLCIAVESLVDIVSCWGHVHPARYHWGTGLNIRWVKWKKHGPANVRSEGVWVSHQHLLILLRAAPTNSFAEFSRWMKDRVKFYLKKTKQPDYFVDVCVNRKEELKTEQINTSRKSSTEQHSGCYQLHHLEYGDY